MSNGDVKNIDSDEYINVPFEDVLEKIGSGKYTTGLVACLAMSLFAMGMEMFGFSLVVTACSCDFQLTRQQMGVLSSIPFISVVLSSYAWGYVADTKGRRLVLLQSMYISFALSTLSSLSSNWILMAILKLVSVCFSCASNVSAYTLLGECSASSIRVRNMLIISIPIMYTLAIPNMLAYPLLRLTFNYDLPWLGITFRPWRLFIIVLAIPCLLTALWFQNFHESPKFLVNAGRNEEAINVLRHMFVTNNRGKPEDFKVKSVVLEEIAIARSEDASFLCALWEQIATLFRPPLLGVTLKLFSIQCGLYLINNGFVMWTSQIFNSLFNALEDGNLTSLSVCDLVTYLPQKTIDFNSNYVQVTPDCNDHISLNSTYAVVIQGSYITVLSTIITKFSARKKLIFLSLIVVGIISCLALAITPNPIAGAAFYIMFTTPGVSLGIMSSYFVELYPTSHRGSAAYVSMMLARMSGVVGVNIIGNVIFDYCNYVFYAISGFFCCLALIIYQLPPDKAAKTTELGIS